MITLEDFKKIDIRVGTIIDRLWTLRYKKVICPDYRFI